jgi:hypothetical protein
MTKQHFSRARQRIFTCRSSSRCGPASGRAISCVCRGSAYDGKHIRLRQSKTGVRVVVPVGGPLKAALDVAKKHGPLILTNSLGRPWTSHGFQASWRIAATKAGIAGLTFHDLRGTAVTRLALVGCTEAEIVTITGHSLRDVRSIMDASYLHRDPALAESAIRKLERGAGPTIFSQPNAQPNKDSTVITEEKPAKSNS